MDARHYQRPDKPLTIPVRDWRHRVEVQPPAAPQPVLTLDRSTECHVTPPAVAQRMVDYLNPAAEALIGEPSAGTGQLVQALLEAGHPIQGILCIEQNHTLAAYLQQRFAGLAVRQQDFLSLTEACFDGLLMNPPFAKGAAKKHLAHAQGLVKPGGRIIALVPANLDYPAAQTLERLPRGTFSSTDVLTQLIEIHT